MRRVQFRLRMSGDRDGGERSPRGRGALKIGSAGSAARISVSSVAIVGVAMTGLAVLIAARTTHVARQCGHVGGLDGLDDLAKGAKAAWLVWAQWDRVVAASGPTTLLEEARAQKQPGSARSAKTRVMRGRVRRIETWVK